MDNMYMVYAITQSVGYVLAAFKNKQDAIAFCERKEWVDIDEEGHEYYLEVVREPSDNAE